jgi:mRNA-degrading endonuclease RelE of RelBE toxin-antitoxin system
MVPQRRYDGFPVPGGQPRHERRLAALDALAKDPYPETSFRWGDMLRLRVGKYRIMYVVEGDLITIQRVDRVSGT